MFCYATVTENNNKTGLPGGAIYTSAATASVTNNSCVYSYSSVETIDIYGHTADVTATGNCWGAANGSCGAGPGRGDDVNGNVNFANFLTTSPRC